MFRLIGAACFAVAAAAQAQTVGIVTTAGGLVSNSAGQAMAKVLVDKAKLRTVVQAQAKHRLRGSGNRRGGLQR